MGNDFLPHLPTLDIGDGGLDKLIQIYKDSLGDMGGYLNQRGILNLERYVSNLKLLYCAFFDFEIDAYIAIQS